MNTTSISECSCSTADKFAKVTTFIENERKCCPFLDFELVVPAEGGDLVLRIHGPEGTREFLDGELPG